MGRSLRVCAVVTALLLFQVFVGGFGIGFMCAILIDVFWLDDS